MAHSNKSRVLLVGGGGVGTMAAYALESGGLAEVTAVLRSNYSAVKQNGFSIDSVEHGQGIKGFRPTQILKQVPDVARGSSQPYDYIVVTTKNIPDVPPTVLDIITPAVTSEKTTILLLQNGVNIERPILEKFPNNIVLSGVSIISAAENEPGHVLHTFRDSIQIGPFEFSPAGEAAAKDFVTLYNACKVVDANYDSNVPFTRWRKLVYNASYNSVSAITGMGVITMRQTQTVIDDLVRPAMLEIVSIAHAKGLSLPRGVEDDMIRIDPPEEGDFLPSMGQDAVKGNFMEVEMVVGEPVREAEKLGVDTPTLKVLYRLLNAMQLRTKINRGLLTPAFADGNPYR